ncbi:hypothetical protein GOODEAATRI_014477, partial [Goodea atripinnis]
LQNSKTSSGDSFYIRVNISLPADTSGAFAVLCNDILHVTNTRPDNTEDLWHASQVHPCQLLDLQSGTVPNYYRLVHCCEPVVDHSPPSPSKSCVTLMPYTLVTPHFPPVCRPILLLPTILGRMLDKKLDSWQGFQLCEPVRRINQHSVFMCSLFLSLLPAFGLSKLQRNGQTEEQLLACSKSEEPLLDKLPCLYHSVDPDSWCDQNSLLTSLRTRIWEEQRKIVWVEPDLW